jgi:4-amino-4-deoxy-L-arabinose transferase-like glycosyltransferase
MLLMQNLDKPMIYILDEAKNAECAREMLVSGDYIMPYFNGQLRTDKPPLHYFFMAAAYKMFGVSAFSARFFSVVFGALTILISFLFCRKYLGEKAGWLTSMVLLSSLHFNFQMRMSVPDPYLIFFMTAGFMCFYTFLVEKRKFWILLMYGCFGLGLLTKGPIAVALPGLIMLVFLIWTKRFNWAMIRSFQIPAGIIIILLISLPWYWLNYKASNGLWTEGFFFKHNLQRFSDTMEGHGGFFLLPLIMVIAGLLPLGIFCIQAMFLAWKQRANEVLLFCLCIVLGIIMFFSFSQTKLPNYTAPAYPFIAILLGFFLSELEGQSFP